MIIYYLKTDAIIKKTVFDNNSETHQVVEKDSQDYQAYLAWVALGNTPLPAEEA